MVLPSASPVFEPAAPVAHAGSFIGASVRITGELFSGEEVHLDGEVQGRMELERGLTVGPTGKVVANIRAREVTVSGSVTGNVETTQRIVLQKGANLVGDVKTAGIVIEDGAYFKGGIDIVRPAVKSAQRPPGN